MLFYDFKLSSASWRLHSLSNTDVKTVDLFHMFFEHMFSPAGVIRGGKNLWRFQRNRRWYVAKTSKQYAFTLDGREFDLRMQSELINCEVSDLCKDDARNRDIRFEKGLGKGKGRDEVFKLMNTGVITSAQF